LTGVTLRSIDSAKSIGFVFALVKYLDRDPPGSDSAWAYRTSSAPNREELLGALRVQEKLMQKELAMDWGSNEPSDGDDAADEDPRKYVPVQDALPGIKLHPIKDAKRIDFVFALVKYLEEEEEEEEKPNESDDWNWAFLASWNLNREELLGALRIQVKILEEELIMEWRSDDSDW